MKKLITGLCLLSAVLAMPAQATDYPQKSIRIIVPFAAGGITDVMGRTIATRLSTELGQPVIVDNKPGASGMIGCEMAAKAAPDGYTLLMAGIAPLGTNPVMYKQIRYDPVKSYEHIGLVAKQPLVVVVGNNVPVQNIQELAAYLKKRPAGDMFYGTSGSSYQLITEAFAAQLGVKMTHVPFKGTSPAIESLLGGQIGFMIDPFSTMGTLVKGGKVKALAITADKRSDAAPQLPTVSESGIQGFEASSWQGLLAPAGTPKEIVQKLNEALVKILMSNEIKQSFAASGVQPTPSTPAEFRQFIQAENQRWKSVAAAANIQPED
ncbi:Bug family tripartite tricarboxylate transporter substrate binding protein [Acidovorax carolinensis]|uniref:Bug family tripartite tricarboxylate transporter substrate binding protein n=1 Tax=Acidovorax carolinensis TaxID=553814 RepID=UPI000B345EEE|nr:tripartite tricarboxylate transporter substrate binding protein [Acidovorax carolinensis]ART49558.1 hypothetical protein CBP33_16715 [Acidovorax carolinensis]